MRCTFLLMSRVLAAMPLLASASCAFGATGKLAIFDESLANGSDCSSTGGQPGFPVRIGYTSEVHTGTYSIAVQNYTGVMFGWCPPVSYSINSDYDGIDFWVNGGSDGGEDVDLILGAVGGGNPVALATLSQLYGAPLPINTWVHIRAQFSQAPFVHPSGTADFNSVLFSVNSGSSTNFFFLDDLYLTFDKVFNDSFDTCGGNPCGASGVLLISQVQSRGDAGGSDEFVELYNPGSTAVAFDATWTLVARSSTDSTYTSRVVGANQTIPAHGHILFGGSGYNGPVAADALLSSGITDASSVVLQHNGAVVDALCFYYDPATVVTGGYICEGIPVSNLPHNNGASGSGDVDVSLERKPGGSSGNTQDTNDNSSDFASAVTSDPHNLASAPVP